MKQGTLDTAFAPGQDSEDDQEDVSSTFLTFSLGAEDYALPISCVTEIVGRQDITLIPDVPSYVRGVINLRGRVIPVLDLRCRFGLEEVEYNSRTCTIVASRGGAMVGLIVDAVREVRGIDPADIEAPPGIALGGGSGFMSGISKVESRVTVILDPEQVLGQGEFEDGMREVVS